MIVAGASSSLIHYVLVQATLALCVPIRGAFNTPPRHDYQFLTLFCCTIGERVLVTLLRELVLYPNRCAWWVLCNTMCQAVDKSDQKGSAFWLLQTPGPKNDSTTGRIEPTETVSAIYVHGSGGSFKQVRAPWALLQ